MNRFDLYELCAQAPEMEARFLVAVHGRGPVVLGEDFAGPGAVARAWLALSPDHRAVIADRDPEPLDHARTRAEASGSIASRLELICDDVMGVGARADVIAAFNFAMCELHTRAQLVSYLRHTVYRLNANGIFAADLYGGRDCMALGTTEKRIRTRAGDVRYTWEQREADPATGRVVNAMHFRTPDGRDLRDAFTYDWRLWSTPELRDAMREAGFRSTEVHDSYGGALDGDGNLMPLPISRDGEEPDRSDEPDAPYVHYIVGRV